MLEWEVLEEEKEPPRVAGLQEAHARRRWRWLLLLLGATLLAGIAIRVGINQQEERIRGDILETIAAEARVMALGDETLALELIDPKAPADWQWRYYRYLSQARPVPGLPELYDLRLEEEGKLAVAKAVWPPPASSGKALPALAEWRAYRRTRSGWRRAPLPIEEAPLLSQESEHFLLRASEAHLSLLNEEPTLQLKLEALRRELAARWSPALIEPYPLTIVIQYQEFGPVVSESRSRRTLLANSPELNYVVSNKPLSSRAHYRLFLTEAIVRKLLPFDVAPEGLPEEERPAYLALQQQLRWAEARWWALDASQRSALHEHWRVSLGGAWRSPFAPLPPLPAEPTAEQERARVEHWIALGFLLDYLIEREGKQILGHLGRALAAPQLERFEPADLFLEVTSLSRSELEAAVRAYAAGEGP